MPGQNVLGDFHFPERAYPERFSYSVVWEVYLWRSFVYTRESFKLYNERKNNDEGKQLRVRSGNNRRVTQPAHYFNEYSFKNREKNKKERTVPPRCLPDRPLFLPSLSSVYLSLTSRNVVARINPSQRGSEKLERV